jgi:hypothetical protein
LTPEAHKRLSLAASTPCSGGDHAWLEQDWLYA